MDPWLNIIFLKPEEELFNLISPENKPENKEKGATNKTTYSQNLR